MSDLEKFVPGARLRMRPFQFFIRTVWCGESCQMDVLIPVPTELRKICLVDGGGETKKGSLPKADIARLADGLRRLQEELGSDFGASTSDGDMVRKEKKEHINVLELRAIYYALREMEEVVKGMKVAIFSDNTTALSYIRRGGG